MSLTHRWFLENTVSAVRAKSRWLSPKPTQFCFPTAIFKARDQNISQCTQSPEGSSHQPQRRSSVLGSLPAHRCLWLLWRQDEASRKPHWFQVGFPKGPAKRLVESSVKESIVGLARFYVATRVRWYLHRPSLTSSSSSTSFGKQSPGWRLGQH